MYPLALWESWTDVNTSHIFSQCILASLTLVDGGTELGCLEPEPRISWVFPSFQWPSLPYQDAYTLPCFSTGILILEGSSAKNKWG